MKKTQCRKVVKSVARFAFWAAVGCIAYRFARPSAVAFRENTAYGGEVLFLGLPVYAACARLVAADFKSRRKEEAEE